MIKAANNLEVCRSLTEEHRHMEKLLAQLEEAVAEQSSETEAWRFIRPLLEQIQNDMNTHFACEEQALFPAVSLYHPMDLMEAEHEALLELRQDLRVSLGDFSAEPEDMKRIRETAKQFISDMLDHIGREDAGIFPVCEQSLSNAEKEEVIAHMARIRSEADLRQPPHAAT